MAVRAFGPAARALADDHFFETVVRIHRSGEGAPFTGLTDRDPEPIILATDRALDEGSAGELERLLIEAVKAGLADRFSAARAKKDFQSGDVAAGRQFVAAYVPLTHWVEQVYAVAKEEGAHESATQGDSPTTRPAIHDEPGHAEPKPSSEANSRVGSQILPWVLAAALGITAGIESAVLVRRRRHAT
jgi:hypothetical protein